MTWKTSGKYATDNFESDSIELGQEETELAVGSDSYSDVYRELAELIGTNNAMKLWKHYRGLTIQFPQRLYSRKFTRQFIAENMNKMTPAQMATLLNLTDRRVRQIIKEIKLTNRQNSQN